MFQQLMSRRRSLGQLVTRWLCWYLAVVSMSSYMSTATAADTNARAHENRVASFSIESFEVSESARIASVTIVLSNVLPSDSTVSIASRADSAIKGEDFYGFYYRVNFNAGDTSKTVAVSIIDDEEVEGTEAFRLRLFNNTQGTTSIADGSASISIVDDDESATVNCPEAYDLPSCVDDEGVDTVTTTNATAIPINRLRKRQAVPA